MTASGPDAGALPWRRFQRVEIREGQVAWQRVTAESRVPSGSHVERLLSAGGTVALFDEVARLAEHAVAVGAYRDAGYIEETRALRPWASVPPTDVEVVTGLLLMVAVNSLRHRGLRWAAVAGWLRVLAGDPDLVRAAELADALDDWWYPVTRFPMEMLGPAVGPLAYAAGLTADEVVPRFEAGNLSVEGLGALAALRGYRLPDVVEDA